MSDQIMVFGGTRETGLEVIKRLSARGDKVTALVRPASDASELEKLGVTIYRGDALIAEDVVGAFATGEFRACINSLGAHRGDAQRPDYIGSKHVIDAAKDRGVRRCIMVSAIGVGDSRVAVAPKVIEVLGPVFELKEKAEAYLVGSGLDYTILRPGGMTDDPESGTGVRTEDVSVMGVINRADLARLVVECLDDDVSIGRTYSTTDPQITWQAPLQRGDDLPAKGK
jgi:uncharacterized protein YbjT (DUF2867 family)